MNGVVFIEAGDICIPQEITEIITEEPNQSVVAANRVNYNDIETYNEESNEWVLTSIQQTSGTFTHLYLKAAVQCQEY